ncbi:MAG: XRE family transcriptional regulator [Acidobacteria bacterium]|nr:MAG: XRE family transcriptional regulator [Acidobacteriota bacterium]
MKSNPLLKKFGVRIRELRKDAGISQEKLAELAELHRTYVSGVERGERNASLTSIARIAKALNVSLSKLFEGVSQ